MTADSLSTEPLPTRLHGGRGQRAVQIRPVHCSGVFRRDDGGVRADPRNDLRRQQVKFVAIGLRVEETSEHLFGVELLPGVAARTAPASNLTALIRASVCVESGGSSITENDSTIPERPM